MKSVYCISYKTRKRLFVGIKAVSLLSSGFSVLYLGLVLYSWYRHRYILHVLVISVLDDLYKNLIPLGVLMFLINVVSFKINRNLKNQPFNHSIPRSHRMWLVFVGLTLISILVCLPLLWGVNDDVDAEVGPRLRHGISRYMDTLAWGSALDRIQTHLKCCGVHGPSDWYSVAWIPLDRLTGHNVDHKLVQPTGRVQVPLVPSSCCRVVSAECGHRAWMDTKTRSWSDIKAADASLLHTAGCEDTVKRIVATDLLVFSVLLGVVAFMEIVLLVAARLLYSSTTNSVKVGRPWDSAPSWLFGPGWFWRKKRYGYLAEYDDRCQHAGAHEPQDGDTPHKSKWKTCLAKCKKSGKGIGSEASSSPEGTRKRFGSPCLGKLKPTKCMAKLKTTCSKTFSKKKTKGGEYVALDSDTGGESEFDFAQTNLRREDKSEPEGRKGSPARMRTGGDRSSRASVFVATKKLSKNLIDVEDVYDNDVEQSEVLETERKQPSPRSEKYSVDRWIKGDLKIPEIKVIDNAELKKRVSVVVEDFKKRRELFENVAASEYKTRPRRDKVEIVSSKPPSLPRHFNMIDLGDVESARSLSLKLSASEMTTLSSVKNEVEPRPAVLRNYPPLTPPE